MQPRLASDFQLPASASPECEDYRHTSPHLDYIDFYSEYEQKLVFPSGSSHGQGKKPVDTRVRAKCPKDTRTLGTFRLDDQPSERKRAKQAGFQWTAMVKGQTSRPARAGVGQRGWAGGGSTLHGVVAEYWQRKRGDVL
jgi:hypothetical protein